MGSARDEPAVVEDRQRLAGVQLGRDGDVRRIPHPAQLLSARAGQQCRAYGAGAIMRVPGQVRISWQDDNTLKVETEAGSQTRLLQFKGAGTADPSWQGVSTAAWQYPGPVRRGGGPRPDGGSLRVATTRLLPGYLRKNGVPYGANARVTEYFNRFDEPNGDSWLIVTTLIDDPEFLAQRFITSSHFKKVADGSPWNPTPCSAK